MAEQMLFRSGGKVYELVERDQISLRDVVTFPRDAAKVLGEPYTWSQFEKLAREVEALTEDEREEHPMAPFVLAVTIWSSRRAAGDKISFDECLDEDFEWVAIKRPTDREPGKRKGAKKAPAKKSPRKAPAKASRPAADGAAD